MGFGIRSRPTTPLIPLPRLRALGIRRVSLPRMLPPAAIMGMQRALEIMKGVIETGEPADRPDVTVGIEDIMKLMGYDEMRALEARLTTF
jgi:2-methylisocitrate lyase-like PEP mutase family enzyme